MQEASFINSCFNQVASENNTKTISKWRGAIAACCLSAALVACGGGGSGGGTEVQPTGGRVDYPAMSVYGLDNQNAIDITGPWLASVRVFRSASNTPGSGYAKVATLRYNANTSLQDIIDFYNDAWDNDNCTIEGVSTSPNTGSGGNNGSSGSPPYVSGGQSVVINTQSGPWATIDQGSDLQYVVRNNQTGPLPADATLSIPGSAFPTVAAYPLYEPAAPVRTSPQTGVAVDADSIYSWVPDSDPRTSMTIKFLEYDASGNFVDFSDMECQVADDGQFELPPIARQFVAQSENALQVRYDREMRRMDYIDGVALYQRSWIAE